MKELSVFEKLRGLYTPVSDIRRKVFMYVASVMFEDKDLGELEKIPFQIVGPESPHYRCCRYKEYYILRERIRAALGFDVENGYENTPLSYVGALAKSDGFEIKFPLVEVIKSGCERCPPDSVFITDLCRKCISHPCILVCPKNCISEDKDRMVIDSSKCIKCGKCIQVCPYNAPTRRNRPCAEACGVDAISTDSEGYATIDHDKCVSCGLCIVSCPFAAIAEKSSIVQVVELLKSQVKDAVAIVAPSFVSQFGPLVSPEAIFEGIKRLGFKDVEEIAYGADLSVLSEAEELKELIHELNYCEQPNSNNSNKDAKAQIQTDGKDNEPKKDFIGTSCCPSWVQAARKFFPDLSHNISESYTPMVETAKKIKKRNPKAKTVMIGPCLSKKAEALNEEVCQFVDYVITFEELAAMFRAKDIDLTEIKPSEVIDTGSQLGRGFPVAKGVATAVISQVTADLEKEGIKCEIPYVNAETLHDCRKMLDQIKKGKIEPKPLLVEGMACPNGCIGGPGTIAPLKLAQIAVARFAKKSTSKFSRDALEK